MSQNTFDGYQPKFTNKGIHSIIAEIIKFRKQLTLRDERNSQSGWDNALNRYMVNELEKIANTLESITYTPDTATQEELEAQAADTTRSLADDYNVNSISSDNVPQPKGLERDVVWDLSGADPDLPQLTPLNCPNDAFRTFVTGLDRLFVELTRLDSRNQPQTVPKFESVQMRALLNELYTITQRMGGEVNRSDILTGTVPTQEPGTVNG